MNARLVAVLVGLVILVLGLAGVLYPDRVMGVLGFAMLNAAHAPSVLGEIRATYGGLFVVMGVYTLLAAMDPPAHRGRLMFVGLLWLGACAGRLVSVKLDGNPGLPGWLAVGLELLMGGALVAAAWVARAPDAPAAPAVVVPAPAPASTPQV